ncbi:hypothetical protein IGI04_040093, partial [Brassica rapa subsp. trilocularis]
PKDTTRDSKVVGCDAPLDHMSSKVKLDGKDKPQYGQIGHLAMVPAKAPFRTYAGLSSTLHGQSVRYGEKRRKGAGVVPGSKHR